jgi:hypothetical protein
MNNLNIIKGKEDFEKKYNLSERIGKGGFGEVFKMNNLNIIKGKEEFEKKYNLSERIGKGGFGPARLVSSSKFF